MKRLIKDFENSMAAAAFAESGDFETARQILNEANSPGEQVQEKEKVESFIEKHDRTEEAIVFAQAGEHEYARQLMREAEKERRKILVVGGEEGFSDRLVYYALSMAERMDYDIVALNVIPVGRRLFSFLNDKVKQDLQKAAEEAATDFRQKASERKIKFEHIVKFGDFDRAIREAHREHKRISFVLAEPEQWSDKHSPNRTSIPVFCLAQES